MRSLRPYQRALCDGVKESAKKGNKRIIACMPTGSGKSICIAELAESVINNFKKVIIVLPRRALVKQLSESFTGWGINHGVVMAKVDRFSMPRCQIISIDTYLSRVASGKMEFIEADCLIVDELQLVFTQKKLELFSKYKFCIAFSATPIAPQKQSLGVFYQDIVEPIKMNQLIAQGYLAPLKYFADPNINLEGLKTDRDGDWRESQLGEVMDKPQLVGDIFKNWERIAKGKSTVIFASSQSHARHLCEEFSSNGYSFEYVDCNTPDDQRQEMFARVKSGKTIGICNVGIVSVGIDIPNLEVCVLARPTRLISVYLQCIGRITRISPDKEHGIVIDHAGIIERLGFATDDYEWSLDGKETVEERLQRKKEENKEPKDIICGGCGYVFRARKSCPRCGFEWLKRGEAIPTHKAELVEVKKPKSTDKRAFYSELLGYCRRNSKADSYALAVYRNRFNEWPHNKRSIMPTEPSRETVGYCIHNNIRYRRRNENLG